MGKVQDAKRRKALVRMDDEERRYKVNLARDFIYNRNFLVNSTVVERILKGQSLVPNIVSISYLSTLKPNAESCDLQNAFSKKLAPLGFDMFPMFVVDLMHEFELGVWKALFIHLLRILEAVDKTLVVELDRR
jgi:hypothetical protein